MSLSKSELLALFAPKVVPITIIVDGREVELHAREMSAAKVFELQAKQKKSKEPDGEAFALAIIAESLCNEDGDLMFTMEDVREIKTAKVDTFNQLTKKLAVAVGLTRSSEESGEGKV